jgi:hypothetical protein
LPITAGAFALTNSSTPLSRRDLLASAAAVAASTAYGLRLAKGEPASPRAAAVAPRPDVAENVILITYDGFRWQDLFNGFDPTLNTKPAGGVASPAALAKRYQRPTPQESRAAVMPFFWDVLAKQGQVFGDRSVDHVCAVTNPYRFSYPGYSEMLCGYVDAGIDSNDAKPNPNVTVLEWLSGRPGFAGKVAAYGAWGVLSAIVNKGRSKLPVTSGWEPIEPVAGIPLTDRQRLLNDLIASTTHYWADECPDALIAEAAIEHLKVHKPRVLYVSLGETDEWAHGRRYDLYLESANRSDAFLRRLWETAQAMPQYAGKTTLILTTDHGRGGTPTDWTSHGAKVPGAEGWWAAAMGPGIPPIGVRKDGAAGQDQIAATVAAAAGEDYLAAQPRAAKLLPLAAR